MAMVATSIVFQQRFVWPIRLRHERMMTSLRAMTRVQISKPGIGMMERPK